MTVSWGLGSRWLGTIGCAAALALAAVLALASVVAGLAAAFAFAAVLAFTGVLVFVCSEEHSRSVGQLTELRTVVYGSVDRGC